MVITPHGKKKERNGKEEILSCGGWGGIERRGGVNLLQRYLNIDILCV